MSTKRVIMDVRGVGEARAKQLKDLGINSVEALAAASEATLVNIRGVSPRIAAELTAAALTLLDTPLPNVASQTVSDLNDDKIDNIALLKQLPLTQPKVKKDKNAGTDKSKKKDRKSEKKSTKKAAKAMADKASKKAEKRSKKEPKTNKGDGKLAKKGNKGKKGKKIKK
ncbi:helix-hairpin-helix domain-containing protein [Paraglaciecola sp. 25GB23A]|uniref:helix-hairpin-helix domain-containing protein n=1 Tax=Paraglaciecola sp. 25GB23A TaxID=3156068 RepID=UPI0032AF6EBE